MREYPTNSPETMARLLTALMAADGRIEDTQIEALSTLDAYNRIGIKPTRFADVLRDYFIDLSAKSNAGTDFAGGHGDPTTEAGLFERLVECITEPCPRTITWDLMIGLALADDEIAPSEFAFLGRVAQHWWPGAVPSRLDSLQPESQGAASLGTSMARAVPAMASASVR